MKKFFDRSPSATALEAMAVASEENSSRNILNYIERCQEALSTMTGHDQGEVTNSGGEALSLVIASIGDKIMLPDQGIWGGTPKICAELGKEICTVKTDRGLIGPETLDKAVAENRPGALVITSFAGYIAEQDVKTISEVCKERKVLLVEDASSSIGDRDLAKGEYSDVIAGSAREPKLLNLPGGGFITSSNSGLMKSICRIKKSKTNHVFCAGIYEELKNAQGTIDQLTKASKRLGTNLRGAIHQNRRGLCTGFLHKNPKRLAKLARNNGFLTEKGRSILTVCPRYDRFLEMGAVVELKKLDFKSQKNISAAFVEFFKGK
jgi:dTDP-4-amino-4,6-dideoxygalactose transaminase